MRGINSLQQLRFFFFRSTADSPADEESTVKQLQDMRGGRKNLKRAVDDKMVALQQGESIMQVIDLRGSNLIEVMDANGHKLMAIFPAKFQKSMWIKRGSFVVVDETGREEAIESGRKVAGIVTQVLYHDQLRLLQKSSEWPDIFKSMPQDNLVQCSQASTYQVQDESCSDEEGLPPLEANTNRLNPLQWHGQSDGDSDSDY